MDLDDTLDSGRDVELGSRYREPIEAGQRLDSFTVSGTVTQSRLDLFGERAGSQSNFCKQSASRGNRSIRHRAGSTKIPFLTGFSPVFLAY